MEVKRITCYRQLLDSFVVMSNDLICFKLFLKMPAAPGKQHLKSLLSYWRDWSNLYTKLCCKRRVISSYDPSACVTQRWRGPQTLFCSHSLHLTDVTFDLFILRLNGCSCGFHTWWCTRNHNGETLTWWGLSGAPHQKPTVSAHYASKSEVSISNVRSLETRRKRCSNDKSW